MKAALLGITSFDTEMELIYYVLEKGFDFIFYRDVLSFGGYELKVNVIRKKNGLIKFDNELSLLLKNKHEEGDYTFFSGEDKGDVILNGIKNFFFSKGVEVMEFDISRAKNIGDINLTVWSD
jgi:hypothetical protein